MHRPADVPKPTSLFLTPPNTVPFLEKQKDPRTKVHEVIALYETRTFMLTNRPSLSLSIPYLALSGFTVRLTARLFTIQLNNYS